MYRLHGGMGIECGEDSGDLGWNPSLCGKKPAALLHCVVRVWGAEFEACRWV
jgi:hypothetical protein